MTLNSLGVLPEALNRCKYQHIKRCFGFLGALGPRTEARVAFVREGNLGHFVRVAFAREVFKKSVERAIGGPLTTIYICIYIYIYIPQTVLALEGFLLSVYSNCPLQTRIAGSRPLA